MWFNWTVLAVTAIVLIGVGAWSGRQIKGAAAEGAGFLLGGRQIGPFIGAGTLIATGYSGWGFIGSPGTAYRYGTVEILANFLFAPAIVFGTMLFAGFMRRRAERSGGLTIPEYLANSHRGTPGQRRLVHFIAGFATFLFLSVYLIGQIRAIGLVASQWLGIPEVAASMLLMLLITVFTIQGGLLAVALTDTLMCIGMLIATVIVAAVMLSHVSPTDLLAGLSRIDPELVNPTTSVPYGKSQLSVFLVFIYALLFTTTLPYMSVRFLSLKEDIKIHRMALYMAPMGVILSLIPLVGLFMRQQGFVLADPDSAMPVFLNTYLPPAVGGVITLFILFAMLSTISSVLQTLASALSYDMTVSLTNRQENVSLRMNRIMVGLTTAWGLFLTFVAPAGMLNQIAYIGTGGLIAMLVGPTIMSSLVEGDLRACLGSMSAGLLAQILLVLRFNVGWVEAPILAGLAGSAVYIVLALAANGGHRKPQPAPVN